jgi:hypothetical protein
MKRAQLELALRLAGEVARDSEFIVFGSQSILGTVDRPPRTCLVSMEVDIYPRHHPQAVGLIAARLGARSAFARENGFFVDCVTPELAAFPEGWTERLIPFRTKQTGGVTGWCVELHDVAASKLAAGREKDLVYIKALFAARLLKAKMLRERILTLPITPARQDEALNQVQRLQIKPSGRKK